MLKGFTYPLTPKGKSRIAEQIMRIHAAVMKVDRACPDQIAISLQEVSLSNAMEMGQIMQAVERV